MAETLGHPRCQFAGRRTPAITMLADTIWQQWRTGGKDALACLCLERQPRSRSCRHCYHVVGVFGDWSWSTTYWRGVLSEKVLRIVLDHPCPGQGFFDCHWRLAWESGPRRAGYRLRAQAMLVPVRVDRPGKIAAVPESWQPPLPDPAPLWTTPFPRGWVSTDDFTLEGAIHG